MFKLKCLDGCIVISFYMCFCSIEVDVLFDDGGFGIVYVLDCKRYFEVDGCGCSVFAMESVVGCEVFFVWWDIVFYIEVLYGG